MVFLGRLVFFVGLIVTVVSLVLGFGLLFAGIANWAQFFLMAIPLGFLLLFAGLSTHVLIEPRESDK